MTEQACCTLCGAAGHRASQCNEQLEREAYDAWRSSYRGFRRPFDPGEWDAWQARAALAQPSPEPVLRATVDVASGRVEIPVAGWAEPLESPPTPDQSERRLDMVDLERPEVVAFLLWPLKGSMAGQRFTGLGEVPADANRELYGYERLMTVAQHERIVGASRAEVEKLDLLHSKALRELNKTYAERDAAQARVAELEKQEPVAFVVDVQGYKRLICATREEAVSNAEHFEKRGRKSPVTPLYAAPAAQAGEVPEDILITWRGFWLEEQIAEMVSVLARLREAPGIDDRALVMAVADAGQCRARALTMDELLAAIQAQGGSDA